MRQLSIDHKNTSFPLKKLALLLDGKKKVMKKKKRERTAQEISSTLLKHFYRGHYHFRQRQSLPVRTQN